MASHTEVRPCCRGKLARGIQSSRCSLTSGEGAVSVAVAPVNDVPTVAGASALDVEDAPTTVDLRPLVSDIETPADGDAKKEVREVKKAVQEVQNQRK